ncbi:dolichyl pyrophosphate Glc1Man9GlcNAc2 alpha-1,3-glucosyltransferase [Pyrus ussuriensis x Pyrus communis]|uniref:Alpha-1,3-glucosyltransferase n=1 Tax=Pyrus ussuriensis x Pyrus communis TaxID=2448454 RepID=A0A5N5EWY9_9ROSA|nr:dolichyl pyrophosphate Glc1Man9GlcNAc2 alpha-1,3-glucosyltransferase [Pyrus ussuriensis x Pyrus communis]
MEAQTAPKLPNPPKPRNLITELRGFFDITACVKLLLILAYKSTDYEVHRHWLATTHLCLFPIGTPTRRAFGRTLDCPPFFAYIELFLSVFANLIDRQIGHLQKGLNSSANTVLYFQRILGILSDLCFLYGVYQLILVVWLPNLVIVDRLHIQYNGFLLGILRSICSSFCNVCVVLLSFIEDLHIYFFGYLLRHYCWKGLVRRFWQLSILGTVVVAVFALVYGSFVYHGQMQQVIHQMFPFGRGLNYAKMRDLAMPIGRSPNFWVFYIILDKVLAFVLGNLGFNIQAPATSFTGGVVGNSSPFAVLPQVILNDWPCPPSSIRHLCHTSLPFTFSFKEQPEKITETHYDFTPEKQINSKQNISSSMLTS